MLQAEIKSRLRAWKSPAGVGIRRVIPIMDEAGLSGIMELSLDFSKLGVEIPF